jgi:hypothetical protein
LYKRNKILPAWDFDNQIFDIVIGGGSRQHHQHTGRDRRKNNNRRGDYSNYLKFFFFFPSFQPCGIGLLTLSSTLSVFSLATFSGTHNDEGGKKHKRRRRREKN